MTIRIATLFLTMAFTLTTANAQSTIQPDEWTRYVQSYVTQEGRVVDTANNSISHSEGQGYGLILSVLAGDRPTFERIWSFTSTQLLVRDDGLAAWRWDPAAHPNITDINNATDGDILIAYGLALGADAWGEAAFRDKARSMVHTIGQNLLTRVEGMPALLPGTEGFDVNSDGTGPLLNLSYWVFEALPVFEQLDPATDWNGVGETGIELVRRAHATNSGLPPDWIVLDDKGQVQPAPGFPPEFGYNGIRIPLYMIRAGIDPGLFAPFLNHADAGGLHKVDAVSGARLEPITEPGYRLIAAAMECVINGTPVPEDLRNMAATSYYAATLQLLMLEHLRRHQPECMGEPTT